MHSPLVKKLLNLGLRNYCSGVIFELTRRCNANCEYCYIKDNSCNDLPTEKILHILDKLYDEGILMLTITGGEPFLRDDILDILSYAVKKDFFTINILTNGSCITTEHLRFFEKYSRYFGKMQFSIFSHKAAVHDRYVGLTGSLEKTIEVSRILKSFGIGIRFALNILDINYLEIDEIHRFFAQYEIPILTSHHKIIIDTPSHDTHVGKSNACTTYDFYKGMFNTYSDDRLIHSQCISYKNKNQDTHFNAIIPCMGIFARIAIDYDGTIRPCVSFRNIEIGSIFDSRSIHEILESSSVLKEIQAIRFCDLIECTQCPYNRYCHTCLGIIYTQYRRLNIKPEQYCNYTKALFDTIAERHLVCEKQ